ncbi:hypothetical protein [Candidatus Borrarchaeum sp.]|uniref:hypothetical protein n=1 Tax=Candidatus Borrarchaeum sp. TaxID=2846742 RepID=UPI002580AC35|nr:hypothetical protein [Candidatus Borrarchaeum sp.]
MKLNELVKRLKDVAQKLQSYDETVYMINENLQVGHGEGIYKFSFETYKKEGSKASIPMGRDFFRDEIKGMASPELLKKTPRFTLEPIYDEMHANKLAIIIKSWSETIPQGFIETLGSTLDLPRDVSLISAIRLLDGEIRLTINSVKIRDKV